MKHVRAVVAKLSRVGVGGKVCRFPAVAAVDLTVKEFVHGSTDTVPICVPSNNVSIIAFPLCRVKMLMKVEAHGT